MEVDWAWYEKQMPGCRDAWIKQFGDDTTGYSFGVSGSRKKGTFKVSATDREFHYGTKHPFPLARIHGVEVFCGCRRYGIDKKWQATH